LDIYLAHCMKPEGRWEGYIFSWVFSNTRLVFSFSIKRYQWFIEEFNL